MSRTALEPAQESPFEVPAVSSGYPLEEREEQAIDRVLEEGVRERDEAGGDGRPGSRHEPVAARNASSAS